MQMDDKLKNKTCLYKVLRLLIPLEQLQCTLTWIQHVLELHWIHSTSFLKRYSFFWRFGDGGEHHQIAQHLPCVFNLYETSWHMIHFHICQTILRPLALSMWAWPSWKRDRSHQTRDVSSQDKGDHPEELCSDLQ